MKKLFAFAIGVTFASFNSANATVIRVNNTTGSMAPYSTVQAAHDAAGSGDTIYVESSGSSYGGLTATKPLVYIGPGYFLNGNQQVNTNTASLSTVFLNSGSEGTQMMGLQLTTVYVGVSNVIFKRNYSGTYTLGHQNPVSDIFISQCYETYVNYWSTPAISNVIISNNYLTGINLQNSNTTGVLAYNNVISGTIYVRNAAVYNNIMRTGTIAVAENSSFSFNMGDSNQFDPAVVGSNSFGNNISNVTMTDVFVGTANGNTNDRQWQLKPAPNAALAAGINGEDLGMYGGNQPYVISGIPAIPAVYFLNTSGVGNNTTPLNVTTKVRSHN